MRAVGLSLDRRLERQRTANANRREAQGVALIEAGLVDAPVDYVSPLEPADDPDAVTPSVEETPAHIAKAVAKGGGAKPKLVHKRQLDDLTEEGIRRKVVKADQHVAVPHVPDVQEVVAQLDDKEIGETTVKEYAQAGLKALEDKYLADLADPKGKSEALLKQEYEIARHELVKESQELLGDIGTLEHSGIPEAVTNHPDTQRAFADLDAHYESRFADAVAEDERTGGYAAQEAVRQEYREHKRAIEASMHEALTREGIDANTEIVREVIADDAERDDDDAQKVVKISPYHEKANRRAGRAVESLSKIYEDGRIARAGRSRERRLRRRLRTEPARRQRRIERRNKNYQARKELRQNASARASEARAYLSSLRPRRSRPETTSEPDDSSSSDSDEI